MYHSICIEPRIAEVDGADASVILPQKCISVASEPWQVYDKNGNGKIETAELLQRFRTGLTTI
jgi:hypothetical protein